MKSVSLSHLTALACSWACVGRPIEQGEGEETAVGSNTETGKPGDGDGDGDDGDGDDGDGDDGDGDGDGEPPLLDPCLWVPTPASECDVEFEPIAVEPPPLNLPHGIAEVGITAREDAVELMWVRWFEVGEFDEGQTRSYLASNAQGAWQHQFLTSDYTSWWPPKIGGSANRTHLVRPYLRREDGQWQRAVLDMVDDDTYLAYTIPHRFAVGPDDRSYLLRGSNSLPKNWIWAETDLGCHRPAWEFELADCRESYVNAIAVDGDGYVHAIGVETIGVDDRGEGIKQAIHWYLGPDGAERTELGPVQSSFDEDFVVTGDSNELHTCREPFFVYPSPGIVFYAHGHDANDWTSIVIEDPDRVSGYDQGYCEFAVAADETVWLTWAAGDFSQTDPFRVASIVDDVVDYEIIDIGAEESLADLAVDPMGRPWIAYFPNQNYTNILKVAHKDAGEWIIESIVTP
jgi:hypothetical protein